MIEGTEGGYTPPEAQTSRFTLSADLQRGEEVNPQKEEINRARAEQAVRDMMEGEIKNLIDRKGGYEEIGLVINKIMRNAEEYFARYGKR